MKFNPKVMQPGLYISENGTVITNCKQMFFRRRISMEENQPKGYKGVTLNRTLSMDKKMYFEVKTSYKKDFSAETGLVFEIGFADLKDLDQNSYLRSTPGTIYIRVETCTNNDDFICLTGHDGRHKYESHQIYLIDESKTFDIRFGFNIKPREDVIEVTLSFNNTKPPNRCFCTFKDAGLHSKMWPVFGISDPNEFKISIKLVNAINLIFNTSKKHPMIFMSDDNREISNVEKKKRKGTGRNEDPFKIPSVLANISLDIEKTEFQKWPNKVHFSVLLEYNISKPIDAYRLFEIGLVRLPTEKYRPKFPSISVIGETCENDNKVCLLASRNGFVKQRPLAKFSSTAIGSNFTGVITFSIDFSDRAITVTTEFSTVLFDNVDFTVPLWPMFALTKKDIDAKMTLNQSIERPWYSRLYYWLKSFLYAFQKM